MSDTTCDIIYTLRPIVEALCGPISDADGELGLDSFSIIELIERVERAFSIVIGPRDLVPEHFSTLNAIAALIKQKQDA
jgi:acyl carrier protein